LIQGAVGGLDLGRKKGAKGPWITNLRMTEWEEGAEGICWLKSKGRRSSLEQREGKKEERK